MIKKVTVSYFKQFQDQAFDLSDHIVLAGPNNSGKTTLLQAIVAWHLALQRWKTQRRTDPQAKQRSAVPVPRKSFAAVPLRDMKMLWTGKSAHLRKEDSQIGKPGYPRPMRITLEGQTGTEAWTLSFEFLYQSAFAQVFQKQLLN